MFGALTLINSAKRKHCYILSMHRSSWFCLHPHLAPFTNSLLLADSVRHLSSFPLRSTGDQPIPNVSPHPQHTTHNTHALLDILFLETYSTVALKAWKGTERLQRRQCLICDICNRTLDSWISGENVELIDTWQANKCDLVGTRNAPQLLARTDIDKMVHKKQLETARH